MSNPRLTALLHILTAHTRQLELVTRRYDAVNDVTEARMKARAWRHQ
jgi:hypothetical protein